MYRRMAGSLAGRKRPLVDLGEPDGFGDADALLPSSKRDRLPAVNPLTQRPWTRSFFEIREQRAKLPVCSYLPELRKALREHQTVVVEGETGSGKTTQVRVVC